MIVAVDHWRGSAEHLNDTNLQDLLPILYETFLNRCWRLRDRIIPLRMNTLEALDEIAGCGLCPDLVYLDADHSYEAVRADLERIRELFPRAVLIGDDWDWETVRQATTDVAQRHGAKIGVHGCAWRFCDAATCAELDVKSAAASDDKHRAENV